MGESENAYIALIGDIAGSRDVEDRQVLQDHIEDLLREGNDFLANADPPRLASRLSITTGDEVQGLFHEPRSAIWFVEWMNRKLHPHRMLFGIGRGTVSTRIVEFPGRIDGECFHKAREALVEARDQYDGTFAFCGFGPMDVPLSTMADLIDAIERRRTPRQREFIDKAEPPLEPGEQDLIDAIQDGVWASDGRGNSQRHIAAHFQVSPSVVSESLKASGYQRVKAGYTQLRVMAQAYHEGRLRWTPPEASA